MTVLLLQIVRMMGLPVTLLVAGFFFYEGIPWLNGIPFIDRVPIVNQFVLGRVQTVANDARRDAVKGWVTKLELDTAKAALAEVQRKLGENARLMEQARQQAAVARQEADHANTELEKRIAQDNDKLSTRWTAYDLERMRNDRR